MSDDNKHNLLYFENESMRGLYEDIEAWQNVNRKRLLSVSIQADRGKFCCIALTNPSEVVITDRSGHDYARISGGKLWVDANISWR